MIVTVIVAALLGGSTPLPSANLNEIGPCVRDRSVELARREESPEVLAAGAIAACKDGLERLVAARDAAASAAGELPSQRPANSAAYRQSLLKLLRDLAVVTIEEERLAR